MKRFLGLELVNGGFALDYNEKEDEGWVDVSLRTVILMDCR